MVHGEGGMDEPSDKVERMVYGASRDVQVFLPAPDCDVVFLFTHILHHFFFEGIGLRQFCDLCRFL